METLFPVTISCSQEMRSHSFSAAGEDDAGYKKRQQDNHAGVSVQTHDLTNISVMPSVVFNIRLVKCAAVLFSKRLQHGGRLEIRDQQDLSASIKLRKQRVYLIHRYFPGGDQADPIHCELWFTSHPVRELIR